MLWLGIGVGVWYLALFAIALSKSAFIGPNIVIAVIGLLTIGGCVISLVRNTRR